MVKVRLTKSHFICYAIAQHGALTAEECLYHAHILQHGSLVGYMSSSNYEYFLNTNFLQRVLIESKGKVQRGFTKTGRKQMRQTFVNTPMGEKWAEEVVKCFKDAKQHVNPDGTLGKTNLELEPTVFASRNIFYIDDDNYVPVDRKGSSLKSYQC